MQVIYKGGRIRFNVGTEDVMSLQLRSNITRIHQQEREGGRGQGKYNNTKQLTSEDISNFKTVNQQGKSEGSCKAQCESQVSHPCENQ